MARVHSSSSLSLSSSPPPQPAVTPAASEQRKQVFTLWMKSLVLNGRGCTVYDSGGRIVYRVDNYGSRCTHDVCLMDLGGRIVLNILKKKLAFGKWEGYRWSDRKQEARAWFKVARPCFQYRSRRRPSSSCEFVSDAGSTMRYRIDDDEEECGAAGGKQGCRIVDDATGLVVAEVKRKVTAGGVALGDDVLTLVVEAHVDSSLIMGLVLVYGLINHTI